MMHTLLRIFTRGVVRVHVHVFTKKFYGKDGVCLALLGRLMTNIRYEFRAWYVNTRACVRECVRACVITLVIIYASLFLLIRFAAKGHNVMHKLKHK